MTSDPAALRAALGDPPLVPASQLDAYWAAIAAGAESAPPPPSGAADLTVRVLGPAVREHAAHDRKAAAA
jgi:hypothetical protein